MRAEPGQVCPIPNWSGYGSAVSLGDRQNAVGRAATQGSRFGSPLVLSRVHWVRPEMVVEVSYVEWTPDGLLRHVVYLGEREDKLATEVRRSRPHSGET
jgi:ATP-dependent DNA ligase